VKMSRPHETAASDLKAMQVAFNRRPSADRLHEWDDIHEIVATAAIEVSEGITGCHS
jgi:hypothetical protein